MIKIDVSKIYNWDDIKQRHKQKCIEGINSNKSKVKLNNNINKVLDEQFLDKLLIGEKKQLIECINRIYNMYYVTDSTYYILRYFYNTRSKIRNLLINCSNKIRDCSSATNDIKTKKKISKKMKKFYNHFRKFVNDENLNENENLSEEIKEKFVKLYYYNYYVYIKDIQKLSKIFNYESVITPEYRHELISDYNLNVCPYCNRQYISNYKNINRIKTTAYLDHFFPKSVYAYLALSLYNFIPSCSVCNSIMKGDKDFYIYPHIYPYEESFDDYSVYFDIEYKELLEKEYIDLIIPKEEDFNIVLRNSSRNNIINNSVETFKLEEVYQIHKGYVRELMRKKYIYDNNKIKELVNCYEELFKSEEEVKLMVYGCDIDEEKNNKTPLSKLTIDIINNNNLNKEIRDKTMK